MPEFLHIVWAVFLIVVFFGGSIFVHELGHYLAARKRGMKVERFSIGFGPKLWSWQLDGVEWCVSLFPLGGYVALPQLANLEGLEGKYEGKPLPPVSYTDTVVVAVMGVVFNMIFAFALASVLWVVGRPSTDSQLTTTVGTVLEKMTDATGAERPGPGLAAGILPGDKILAIDDAKVNDWRDVKQAIVTSLGRNARGEPEVTLVVERAGKTLTLRAIALIASSEKLRSLGLLPQEELFIGQIFKNSPAARAGLKTDDQLVSLDGQPVLTYYGYAEQLEKIGTRTIALEVQRGAQRLHFRLAPQPAKISKDGKTQPLLGFEFKLKEVIVHEDPLTQIGGAAALTWRTLATLVYPNSDIKLTHLSGPPGIAWFIYRLSSDLRQLLSFIVIINVNLAILNLLPLPVLDGGHIVLATVGKLRRKPVSGEYVATLQNIFTVLLLALMVYVMLFADLPRLKREWQAHRAEKKEQQELLAEPEFDTSQAAR